MCLVLTLSPLLPPLQLQLQLFGQLKEHLVVRPQQVLESLGAFSFYEILVSLWVWWVVLWLPRVYWFVNLPRLAEKQMDPWIGVE